MLYSKDILLQYLKTFVIIHVYAYIFMVFVFYRFYSFAMWVSNDIHSMFLMVFYILGFSKCIINC